MKCSTCGESASGYETECAVCSDLRSQISDVQALLDRADPARIREIGNKLLGTRAGNAMKDIGSFTVGVVAHLFVPGTGGKVASDLRGEPSAYSAEGIVGKKDAEYFKAFKDMQELRDKLSTELKARADRYAAELAAARALLAEEEERKRALERARRLLE